MSQEDLQDRAQEPLPPKKGMSGGTKVLLILACVAGVCLLLCCGVGIWIAPQLKNLVQNAITTDPDEIRSRTQKIARIDIPDDFKPATAMDMKVMKWVVYTDESNAGSILMLMEFDASMQQSREQMQQQQQQQIGKNFQIKVEETKTRELTVRGESTPFEFIKGKTNGRSIRQVSGFFNTAHGVAMLTLIVSEEKYDEEAIVKMIESIGDPVEADEAVSEALDSMDAGTDEEDAVTMEETPTEAGPSDAVPAETPPQENPPAEEEPGDSGTPPSDSSG